MTKDNELYYIDKHGKRQDASLHAEMLNNTKARSADMAAALKRAVKSGMSKSDALRLYGPQTGVNKQDTAAMDWKLPPAPGTGPIPKDHVRLYHQTHSEQTAEHIRHQGILWDKSKGIEGPRAIYADEKGFYRKPEDGATVEFHVHKDRWQKPFVVGGDVKPEDIIGVHHEWHKTARYIEDNPRIKESVINGKHDDLIKRKPKDSEEDKTSKAIRFIKHKYKRSANGEFSSGKQDEAGLDTAAAIQPLSKVHSLAHKLIQAAQKVYDDWDQDEEGHDEELGCGGICHLIAEAFVNILDKARILSSTVSSNAEVHVYTVFRCKEGVYELDLPYRLYEHGGGYTWTKKPNVKFETDDLYIHSLDAGNSIKTFNQYTDNGSTVWVSKDGHLSLADFVDSEHPRAHDGEFTSKSGGSSEGENSAKKLVPAEMQDGKPVNLPEHISKLKLPPAWTDIHYNPDPKSALLAIGKDAKGRAQYVYSDEHVSRQAIAKFHRIRELDKVYMTIQAQNAKNKKSDDAKTRDHADCLDLIMQTGIRPGSDEDTGAEKKAYGATTLTGQHVTLEKGQGVVLKFTGKKGVDLAIPVTDKKLAKTLMLRAKEAGPDGKLFSKVSDGSLRDYSHTLGGKEFKVKDFRTRHANKVALEFMQNNPRTPTDEKTYRKAVMEVAQHASKHLGNTPSICLTSYLSPELFSGYKQAAGV